MAVDVAYRAWWGQRKSLSPATNLEAFREGWFASLSAFQPTNRTKREEIAETIWHFRYGRLPDARWDEAKRIARDIPDGAAARSVSEVYAFSEAILKLTVGVLSVESDSSSAKLDEWLAIETAPKNQRVLIYKMHENGGCDQTAMACLPSGNALWITMPDERLVGFVPTHWRPLPEPPQGVRQVSLDRPERPLREGTNR